MMDEKHFIWIVPMLLVIGFVVGFVSGLNIPKEITIGVEPDTLQIINRSFDERLICDDYKVNLSICEYELNRQVSESVRID